MRALSLDEQGLLRTVTAVTTTLRAAGIRFAIAGGCAAYAHGGPPSDHDVDVFVKEEDAETARRALIAEGMRAADPPEDWLTKVYDDGRLVDLIFRPNNRPVTDEILERAQPTRIGPVVAPVVTATDLMIDKLRTFGPHTCDFGPLLPIARVLREQVDWRSVHAQVRDSPYAVAFLRLIEDLDIIGETHAPDGEEDQAAYPTARLHRALAEDPRTAEPWITVTVAGNCAHLSGTVISQQRKDFVEQVVRETDPRLTVDNQLRVAEPGVPEGREELR